jgi:hypothetical protein
VVLAEGKVVVVGLCTSCGDPFAHTHIVTKPNGVITMAGPPNKMKGQKDVIVQQ